jgi:putative tryptophan/tyrosine transport system substrate-binding protein
MQFGQLKRRELMSLLCGAAVAWPLVVRATPVSKSYRVAWFFSSTPLAQMEGPDPIIPVGRALVHGLRDMGYVEGQNLILERRSAEGRFDRIDEIAAELVSRNPDVIVTGGGNMLAQALQRVTKSVPIVMPDSDDPVAAGLVESLARPGGNITGFTGDTGPEFEGKRLELLKEAFPEAIRVAYLALKEVWESPAGRDVQDAARTLGVTLIYAEHTPDRYDDAFALMIRDRANALLVARHPENYVNRQLIADFAAKQRMPSMTPYRDSVIAGGLMSYGVSATELFRRAAGLVDKILKGAKPADIPIERPTKLELVVNLKTAKALELTISNSILARADEVIE